MRLPMAGSGAAARGGAGPLRTVPAAVAAALDPAQAHAAAVGAAARPAGTRVGEAPSL